MTRSLVPRRLLSIFAALFVTDAGAAELTCLAEHVAVRPGSTVSVRAHPIGLQDDARFAIAWQATAGSFVGEGEAVEWRVDRAGEALATATLTHGTETVACTIRLQVVQPTLSTARIRKYFLVGDEAAPPGFGTYSYLLLGERIDPAQHENRKIVVAAFLRMLEELSQSDSRSRDRLVNLTMIPVTSAPPPVVLESPGRDEAWEWLIANFNYRRAQEILDAAAREHGTGPFIVSSRQSPNGEETFVQDLTAAHGAAAERWVRLHVFLTTQERDWNRTEFRSYAVKTINALSVFAEAVPEAIQGVSTAVTWIVQLKALSE